MASSVVSWQGNKGVRNNGLTFLGGGRFGFGVVVFCFCFCFCFWFWFWFWFCLFVERGLVRVKVVVGLFVCVCIYACICATQSSIVVESIPSHSFD